MHLSTGFKLCLHHYFYISVADIPVNTLGDDFVKLVNDPTFSDVCFKVEGKKVHAHKAILVVRSKYFKAMFTTQMEEASKVDPFSARLHVYNSYTYFCLASFPGSCVGLGSSVPSVDFLHILL